MDANKCAIRLPKAEYPGLVSPNHSRRWNKVGDEVRDPGCGGGKVYGEAMHVTFLEIRNGTTIPH